MANQKNSVGEVQHAIKQGATNSRIQSRLGTCRPSTEQFTVHRNYELPAIYAAPVHGGISTIAGHEDRVCGACYSRTRSCQSIGRSSAAIGWCSYLRSERNFIQGSQRRRLSRAGRHFGGNGYGRFNAGKAANRSLHRAHSRDRRPGFGNPASLIKHSRRNGKARQRIGRLSQEIAEPIRSG